MSEGNGESKLARSAASRSVVVSTLVPRAPNASAARTHEVQALEREARCAREAEVTAELIHRGVRTVVENEERDRKGKADGRPDSLDRIHARAVAEDGDDALPRPRERRADACRKRPTEAPARCREERTGDVRSGGSRASRFGATELPRARSLPQASSARASARRRLRRGFRTRRGEPPPVPRVVGTRAPSLRSRARWRRAIRAVSRRCSFPPQRKLPRPGRP